MSTNLKKLSTQSRRYPENITNIKDIRDIAIIKLQRLLNNDLNADDLEDINNFCKITNTILNTLKLEIMYFKSQGEFEKIDFIEDQNIIEG